MGSGMRLRVLGDRDSPHCIIVNFNDDDDDDDDDEDDDDEGRRC